MSKSRPQSYLAKFNQRKLSTSGISQASSANNTRPSSVVQHSTEPLDGVLLTPKLSSSIEINTDELDSTADPENVSNIVEFLVLSLKTTLNITAKEAASYILENNTFSQFLVDQKNEKQVLEWLSFLVTEVSLFTSLIVKDIHTLPKVMTYLIPALNAAKPVVRATLTLIRLILPHISKSAVSELWEWFVGHQNAGISDLLSCYKKFHNPYSSTSKKILRSIVLIIDDITRPNNQYFYFFSEILKTRLSNDPLAYLEFLNVCLVVWSGSKDQSHLIPQNELESQGPTSNVPQETTSIAPKEPTSNVPQEGTSSNEPQVSNAFEGREALAQSNIVGHLVLYTVHYASKVDSTDEKLTRQTQMEAVKVLAQLWLYFEERILHNRNYSLLCKLFTVDTETLKQDIQGAFRACCRSTSYHVQHAAVDQLFYLLLSFLDKEGHAEASMYIFKLLLFTMLENHPNDSVSSKTETNLRFYVMSSFQTKVLANTAAKFPTSMLQILLQILLRQIWICGYSNHDFDMLLAISEHPQLEANECLQIMKLLCSIMGEDTIYSSTAISICIHLSVRFCTNTEVNAFMLQFFRDTIASIACMEAALTEAASQQNSTIATPSFAATKAREVHINLSTDTIAKFIQIVEAFQPMIRGILSNVLNEFEVLYSQPPAPLVYLLQTLNQQRPSSSHFTRNKPKQHLELKPYRPPTSTKEQLPTARSQVDDKGVASTDGGDDGADSDGGESIYGSNVDAEETFGYEMEDENEHEHDVDIDLVEADTEGYHQQPYDDGDAVDDASASAENVGANTDGTNPTIGNGADNVDEEVEGGADDATVTATAIDNEPDGESATVGGDI